jgi:hypothetical protein
MRETATHALRVPGHFTSHGVDAHHLRSSGRDRRIRDQVQRCRLRDLSPKRERPSMTLPSANDPIPLARTTTVYRPAGGIDGYREIYDEVSQLTVASFPWASLREVPVVLVPGAYVLATHDRSYFGETNEIKRRMSEQARDKSWVREAYVVSGLGKSTKLWFDSRTPEYFQYRFNELAERAGLVDVVKGANPRFPDLSDDRRATLEALLQQSLPLLFDAGCRVFHSAFGSMRRIPPEVEMIGLEDAGSMKIGVTAAAPPGSELEISYFDLWARGYPVDGGFTVLPGSEVFSTNNPSGRDWVDKRRTELREAGALLAIPGLIDRERLCAAVEFETPSAAAKFVTGSRDSGKWILPRYSQPILSAA